MMTEANSTTTALLDNSDLDGQETLYTSSLNDSLMYLMNLFICTLFIGTEGKARTHDPRFWRPMLYRLSYFRVKKSPIPLFSLLQKKVLWDSSIIQIIKLCAHFFLRRNER